MLKVDGEQLKYPKKKLNTNYAKLPKDVWDQKKFHLLLPHMVEL